MTTLALFIVAVLLVIATVLVHYEVLRMTGRLLPRLPIKPRQRVLVVIGASFAAHGVETVLYAFVFAALHQMGGFGEIEGHFDSTAIEYLYFSISSYTTLGMGDAYPTGLLRILAAIEALNGFLLISWSASFTYLMMQRYWHPERDN